MSEENEQLNEFSFLTSRISEAKVREIISDVGVVKNSIMQAVHKIPEVLGIMGYDALRAGQDEAVLHLIAGRDVYCVLPTGTGKSAIYIIPTLCLNWRTLIVSPLISLMQDQVEGLLRRRLPAVQISSGQTSTENLMDLRSWESGDVQFMLVSPERMENEVFASAIDRAPPDMICLDEAHCLSSWAHSFRPAYAKLGKIIERWAPKVVLSMTATSTPEIEHDIRSILGIQQAIKVVHYPKRENLHMITEDYRDDRDLINAVSRYATGSTIVYCGTRKNVEDAAEQLAVRFPQSNVLSYHGGMSSDARYDTQRKFMSGESMIMSATNAFGMGVDKPDIRAIVHRDFPGSIEALVQEQGRAGRDGLDSYCVMLFNERSLKLHEFFAESSYPERYVIEQVYHTVKRLGGREGVIQITSKDLAAHTGLNERFVTSSLSILTALGVFERATIQDSPAKFRILKQHPDTKMDEFMSLITTHGVLDPADGHYQLQLSVLVQHSGVKYATVQQKIRSLEKNAYIYYVAPYRGKITKVISDLSKVPWDKIERRRRMQLQKIKELRDFVSLPDEHKHDALLEYFHVAKS